MLTARPGHRRFVLASAVVYAVAVLVVTLPLPLHLASAIPAGNEPALALRNLWAVNWSAQHLLSRPRTLLAGNVFHPSPASLAMGELLLPEAVVAFAVRGISSNPCLAYNVAFLTSILLSGLGVLLLVRRLTASRTAAVAAGLAAILLPLRFALASSLEFQGLGWTALSLWSLLRLVERPGVLRAATLALATAAALLSCLALGSLTLLSLVVLLPFLLVRERAYRNWRVYASVLGAFLVGAVLTAPYAPARLRFALAGGEQSSAPGLGSETPSLFPGFVLVALGLGGVALSLARVRDARWRQALPFTLLALLALAWLLGGAGTAGTVSATLLPPLPVALLLHFATTVLAGFALSFVAERRPRLLVPALIALSLESLAVPLPLTTVADAPVDAYLASLPGATPLVELPMEGGGPINATYMVHALSHGKPSVNGYAPRLPVGFRDFAQGTEAFPDLRALASLMSLDVGLVVLHSASLPPAALAATRARIAARSDYLHETARFGGDIVYALDSSFRARQEIQELLLTDVPDLPHLPAELCFAAGEDLKYEIRVGVLKPAELRLRVLPGEAPGGLVLRLDLEPTSLGRRFLPGSLSLEDALQAPDRAVYRQTLRLHDTRGLFLQEGRFASVEGQTQVAWNGGRSASLPADARSGLEAIYATRCLKAVKGDRYRLGLVGAGGLLKVMVTAGDVEHIPIGGADVAARMFRIEPQVSERSRFATTRMAFWISEDSRHVPVMLEVIPPSGFQSGRAVLVSGTVENRSSP